MFWFGNRNRKFIDAVYYNSPFYGGVNEDVVVNTRLPLIQRLKEKEVFTIPRDFIQSNYPYPYIIDVDEPYTFPPIIDIPYSYKQRVNVVTTNNDDFASRFFEAYFKSQAIKLKYLFS